MRTILHEKPKYTVIYIDNNGNEKTTESEGNNTIEATRFFKLMKSGEYKSIVSILPK